MVDSCMLRLAAALCLAVCLPQESGKTPVRFLSAKEAADAIVDESMEPYFSLLQPLEMHAKTGSPVPGANLAAQRDECRKRYREAVRDFTDHEKAALTQAAEGIRAALKEAYPFFASTPWSFVKIESTIEGGMPHTRGPHVVVPSKMAAAFAGLHLRREDVVKTRLAQTLIHELCHVLQRAHPGLFADLYGNVWSLIRAKGIPSDPWLDKVQIVNPDGPDVGWIYAAKDGFWQPLVVLKDGVEKPVMPRDFLFVGVAREKKGDAFPVRLKDGKPETMPLKNVPGYMEAFPANAGFHPNETFAELFAAMAMKDHIADPGQPAADFTTLRDWCRKNFAQAPEKK
jgi:hypothetical protein